MSSGSNHFEELIAKYSRALSEVKENGDPSDLAKGMWRDIRWEELIVSAPAAINLLGALVLLGASAEADFDLDLPNGSKQFDRIQNASFRAAVQQLRTLTINAYDQSRDNLMMLAVRSDELKPVQELLPEGNADKENGAGVAFDLSTRTASLEQHRAAFTQSSDVLKETSKQFSNAFALAMELTAQTSATQGSVEKHKEEVERRRAACERTLRTMEEKKAEAEKGNIDQAPHVPLTLNNLLNNPFGVARGLPSTIGEENQKLEDMVEAAAKGKKTGSFLEKRVDDVSDIMEGNIPRSVDPNADKIAKNKAARSKASTSIVELNPDGPTDKEINEVIRAGEVHLVRSNPFLVELGLLQDEEAKLKNASKVPRDAMVVLTSLAMPLQHLKGFFHLLGESMEARIHVTLESLGRVIQSAAADTQVTSPFANLTLTRECSRTVKLAHVVWKVANLYAMLHDKHIQPGMTSVLNRLPASLGDVQHDPKALAEMEGHMKELQKWESQAQHDMLSAVRRESRDFNSELDNQAEAEVGHTFASSKGPMIFRAAPAVTEALASEHVVVAEPK